MYKYILVIMLLLVTVPTLNAQTLTGTSWKGTLLIPNPENCIMQFGRDTLNLLLLDASASSHDTTSVETMSFHQSGDTVSIVKILGNSPCGTETGKYKVTIAGGKLTLSVIDDPCGDRAEAFKNPLDKISK